MRRRVVSIGSTYSTRNLQPVIVVVVLTFAATVIVQLNISRVMIIDLDAHQGNGHETDLPMTVESISWICTTLEYIHLITKQEDLLVRVLKYQGTTTAEYLRKLDEALEVAAQNFDPELIVYNAGTDILDGDPLGRLKISPDGITNRDEKVFRFAREKNVSIVMLTSGGYMKSSARVIADSIANLSNKSLIDTGRNTTLS